MKNILVTGGAGFIGCNFVRYLLAEYPESQICNLDALTYAGSRDNLLSVMDDPRHQFVHGNICDADLVANIFSENEIDTVVHLAAESHVDRSIDGPREFVQTNVVGTYTLLEVARQAWLNGTTPRTDCRFHHVSTDEVYGSLGDSDPAFAESHPYQPSSPYSATKAGSDHLVNAYWKTYDLPITISNCSNNYGPFQHAEKLIPTIIRCCLRGEPIPIYGDGRNIRDWLFVDDHCVGIDAILKHGQIGRTYNIGGNSELTNIELARIICRLMDNSRPGAAPHDELIHFVTDRPGHDWRYSVNTARIEAELGWSPQHSFESAMLHTLNWYLDRLQ